MFRAVPCSSSGGQIVLLGLYEYWNNVGLYEYWNNLSLYEYWNYVGLYEYPTGNKKTEG